MMHRSRLALAAFVLFVFGVVLSSVCLHRDAGHEPASIPPVLHYDEGGLRYTYHVVSADEGLFDLSVDPKMLKNLRGARPDDARRLREELQKRLREKFGVETLEEVRRARQDAIDRMRGLGYF
jgi:hypothetical protein